MPATSAAASGGAAPPARAPPGGGDAAALLGAGARAGDGGGAPDARAAPVGGPAAALGLPRAGNMTSGLPGAAGGPGLAALKARGLLIAEIAAATPCEGGFTPWA